MQTSCPVLNLITLILESNKVKEVVLSTLLSILSIQAYRCV